MYTACKKRKGGMYMQKKTVLTALGVTAGVGAGIAAARLGVVKAMTDVALDRELPEYARHFRVSGTPENETVRARQREAAKALEALPRKEITIRSFDGLKLVGHLVTCDEPRRLIIAAHGWRSSWSRDFGIIAPFWRENHCNVLYVEQRSQGGSGGQCMGFGLLERYDCAEWAEWAAAQNYGLPVYLAGISMGATPVLMASGLELPDCVRGIMADCGFVSPQDIWKHVANHNLHMYYGALREKLADRQYRKKTHLASDGYSTLTAMEHNHLPVLFVHGAAETFVPIEMTYKNYLACKAPKRLVVVPGASHGMSCMADPEACHRAMLDFWRDFDM